MNVAEEQRAADYRAEQTARFNARAALHAQLAGSPSAVAALRRNWAPVLDRSPGFDLPNFEDVSVGPEAN